MMNISSRTAMSTMKSVWFTTTAAENPSHPFDRAHASGCTMQSRVSINSEGVAVI